MLKECETKSRKTKEECKHKEKKNEWLQRRLHKSEQEKKRAINRQNDAEMKLAQHQEQYILNTDISLINQDSIDENDIRMLKLKLQSTEAKLQMIEGNKGYLEKKVNSLERKVSLFLIFVYLHVSIFSQDLIGSLFIKYIILLV